MKNYRITYAPPDRDPPVVVEGLASSRSNAARKAFRTMIAEGYIKNTPRTTNNGGFQHTTIEVIPDAEDYDDE